MARIVFARNRTITTSGELIFCKKMYRIVTLKRKLFYIEDQISTLFKINKMTSDK